MISLFRLSILIIGLIMSMLILYMLILKKRRRRSQSDFLQRVRSGSLYDKELEESAEYLVSIYDMDPEVAQSIINRPEREKIPYKSLQPEFIRKLSDDKLFLIVSFANVQEVEFIGFKFVEQVRFLFTYNPNTKKAALLTNMITDTLKQKSGLLEIGSKLIDYLKH